MARTRAQRIGAAAESRALAHLRRAGLELVERNWHCRFGEIDLVMRDGDALVFVEVRSRRRLTGRFLSARDSVGPNKRARLQRSAECYLARDRHPPPCRFDVVAIDEGPGGEDHLDWVRDAFH